MAKKGYWIAHVEVTNPERYKDYVAANAAPLKKYGGRFLVRGGDCIVPEGKLRLAPPRRHRVRELRGRQGLLRVARVPGRRQDPRRARASATSSSSRAGTARSPEQEHETQ